jgi:Zn-dependent protease
VKLPVSLASPLRLGRVAGIPVDVHGSFFITGGLLAFAYFQRGSLRSVVLGLAFIVALFVAILVHEVAHVLVGHRLGAPCRRIELNAFGGYAQFAVMPRHRLDEIAVLVAGPCSNFALALLFGAAAGWAEAPLARAALHLARDLNVVLFVFNLLPAMPLDGGRALHLLAGSWLGARRTDVLVGALGLLVAGYCLLVGIVEPVLLFAALAITQASMGLLQGHWRP